MRHAGDFGSVKCGYASLSPRTASFFMDAEQIVRKIKITTYAADTLASRALYWASARRTCNKNEPGGVFSSPKLKKFWLRVFQKLKTKILLASTISGRFEANLAGNFSLFNRNRTKYGRRAFSANIKKNVPYVPQNKMLNRTFCELVTVTSGCAFIT